MKTLTFWTPAFLTFIAASTVFTLLYSTYQTFAGYAAPRTVGWADGTLATPSSLTSASGSLALGPFQLTVSFGLWNVLAASAGIWACVWGVRILRQSLASQVATPTS